MTPLRLNLQSGMMTGKTSYLPWLDKIRILAIAWIVLNHLSEQVFGFPYFANPTFDWPPLVDRISQIVPVQGRGFWDIPINLFRYLGWTGDQGVQIFILISGFGLAWGSIAHIESHRIDKGEFYLRRFRRIYPQWWVVHIFFLLFGFLSGWGVSPTDRAFYLSFLGIRFTPGAFYYFAPAWWFVGLLLQLYLVYPVIWDLFDRFSPIKVLLTSSIVGFIARALGLIFLPQYVDPWLRGSIFITRLPEFILGMYLAVCLSRSAGAGRKRLFSLSYIFLALLVYLAGTLLSFTRAGMVVSPFMQGLGLFILLLNIFARNYSAGNQKTIWTRTVANYIYPAYLIHHPLILLLLPMGIAIGPSLVLRLLMVLAAILVGTVMLELGTRKALILFGAWRTQFGLTGIFVRGIVFVVSIVLIAISLEVLIRKYDPQEILGWGERISLDSDPEFGWKLKPDGRFHLRWQSYDYKIYTNSLGFQGPNYAEEFPAAGLRIMVLGDAFSSAEGVDTDQAWPRVLESELGTLDPNRQIEVLNFAVTGYGPDQYLAVAEKFVPEFKPDWIVVSFFVNDFEDVLFTNDQFRSSIGFGKANPDGIYSYLSMQHLRSYLHHKVVEPLESAIKNEPSDWGYFLGNFAMFDPQRTEITTVGRAKVSERISQLRSIADKYGAKMLLLEVPASIQVCNADDLAYFPNQIDLIDDEYLDINLPQRMITDIAISESVDYLDLRPFLIGSGKCHYQPSNMHWLPSAHRITADTLVNFFSAEN